MILYLLNYNIINIINIIMNSQDEITTRDLTAKNKHSLEKITTQYVNDGHICSNNDEYWCNKDNNNPCKKCQRDLTILERFIDGCMVCEGTNNIEKYNQTVRESPRQKDFGRGHKICFTNAICLFCEECRAKAKKMTAIPAGWDDWDILDEIIQSIRSI